MVLKLYNSGKDMNVDDKGLIYIRKYKNKFSLVCENEDFDTSCRIYYCPICGRKLM